jgi:hypothetical protein
MFKGKINPVNDFSDKTKIVWTDENGRLTVHVESTDPVELIEAERMLKQGLAYIYKQMNVPFPNND